MQPLEEISRSLASDRAAEQHISHRLSTWLLVGNAGGLLLTINAKLDHKICDQYFFTFAAVCFALGALAALSAQVVTVWRYQLRRQRIETNLSLGNEERALSIVREGMRDSVIVFLLFYLSFSGVAFPALFAITGAAGGRIECPATAPAPAAAPGGIEN